MNSYIEVSSRPHDHTTMPPRTRAPHVRVAVERGASARPFELMLLFVGLIPTHIRHRSRGIQGPLRVCRCRPTHTRAHVARALLMHRRAQPPGKQAGRQAGRLEAQLARERVQHGQGLAGASLDRAVDDGGQHLVHDVDGHALHVQEGLERVRDGVADGREHALDEGVHLLLEGRLQHQLEDVLDVLRDLKLRVRHELLHGRLEHRRRARARVGLQLRGEGEDGLAHHGAQALLELVLDLPGRDAVQGVDDVADVDLDLEAHLGGLGLVAAVAVAEGLVDVVQGRVHGHAPPVAHAAHQVLEVGLLDAVLDDLGDLRVEGLHQRRVGGRQRAHEAVADGRHDRLGELVERRLDDGEDAVADLLLELGLLLKHLAQALARVGLHLALAGVDGAHAHLPQGGHHGADGAVQHVLHLLADLALQAAAGDLGVHGAHDLVLELVHDHLAQLLLLRAVEGVPAPHAEPPAGGAVGLLEGELHDLVRVERRVRVRGGVLEDARPVAALVRVGAAQEPLAAAAVGLAGEGEVGAELLLLLLLVQVLDLVAAQLDLALLLGRVGLLLLLLEVVHAEVVGLVGGHEVALLPVHLDGALLLQPALLERLGRDGRRLELPRHGGRRVGLLLELLDEADGVALHVDGREGLHRLLGDTVDVIQRHLRHAESVSHG
mmetsp:Transcript_101870/g.283761  ORF Transcript_101870/g.283761 Transcript_101870/m.283761 type:complete len:663 (+) Transcript_101870:22-2010(+)